MSLAAPSLHARTFRTHGQTVLVVTGTIDTWNVGEFRAALDEALSSSDKYLIVDISHVQYACARVFGLLSAAGAKIATRGGALTVTCPQNSFLCRILGLVRFPYSVAYSVDEAIAKRRGQAF